MAREIDRLGTVLSGKWRIERKLGEGGMGAVYAATHVRNAKRVAVKLLHDAVSDPDSLARFQREGYAANVIDDSGVVAVYDDGLTDDGAAYLVMELLDGESFEERAERNGGKLGTVEVLSLMHPALVVLQKAHALGVVHRDLKPSNLFVTTSSQIKVLDFGLAAVRSAPHLRVTTAATPTMGTLGFMPPEQARGDWEVVGPRSDVWALGATMFALLSGLCPHEHGDMGQFLKRALCDPAPPLRSAVSHVPREVAAVVDKALAFDPAARFADAGEMRIAIEHAYESIASLQNEVTAEVIPPFLGDATLSILDAPPSSTPRWPRAPEHIGGATMKSAPETVDPMRAGQSLVGTSLPGTSPGRRKWPPWAAGAGLAIALLAGGVGAFTFLTYRASSQSGIANSVGAHASATPGEMTGVPAALTDIPKAMDEKPMPRTTVSVSEAPPLVAVSATAALPPAASAHRPTNASGTSPASSATAPSTSAATPSPTSSPTSLPPQSGKPDLDRRH